MDYGVADGSFPIIVIALLLSALVAVLGLYIIFSERLSPEATGSAFAVVCCVGYAMPFVLLGNTMIALVIPFVPAVTQ